MLVAAVLSACTQGSLVVPGGDPRREPPAPTAVAWAPAWHAAALRPRPPRDTPEPTPEPPPDDPEPVDTGDVQPAPPALVAAVTADVDEGEFPLTVSFDATASQLGAGAVRWSWDLGDGGWSDEPAPVHTYVGAGAFVVELTIEDEATGALSTAQVTIEVERPDCPDEDEPVEWGRVGGGLDSVSGMAASRRDPDAYWLHEDRRGGRDLVAVDSDGDTIGEYDLDDDLDDFEDIEAAVDPESGVPYLFLGDIGDNNGNRDEIAVWLVEEPDPRDEGDVEPIELELTYPDEPHNAETLIVDPFTFDLYILTKEPSDDANVFVKRAPHEEGSFELEEVGSPWTLDLTATSGDASPDGSRVVVRDYSDAKLFFRDGYLPFEDTFDEDGCNITLHPEEQGEAIAFTADGEGIVTTSEGAAQPLYYVELE